MCSNHLALLWADWQGSLVGWCGQNLLRWTQTCVYRMPVLHRKRGSGLSTPFPFPCLTQPITVTVPEIKVSDNRYALVYLGIVRYGIAEASEWITLDHVTVSAWLQPDSFSWQLVQFNHHSLSPSSPSSPRLSPASSPLSHLTCCQRCVDRPPPPPLADATQVRAMDTCQNLSRTSCSTQVGPCFVRPFVVFCSPLSSLPPCIAYLSCIKPPFAWPWPAPNHSLLFPPILLACPPPQALRSLRLPLARSRSFGK